MNRWGLVPALFVAREGDETRLLQVRELELGQAVFAPEWISGSCADLMRAAERRGQEARLGVWADPDGHSAVYSADAPEQLSERTGEYALVRGRIVSLGKTSRTRYLNFGKYWKTDVTATLDAEAEIVFDTALERTGWRVADLAGKLVEVRGIVEERDGPHIFLRHPEQLVVLEHPVFR